MSDKKKFFPPSPGLTQEELNRRARLRRQQGLRRAKRAKKERPFQLQHSAKPRGSPEEERKKIERDRKIAAALRRRRHRQIWRELEEKFDM